MKRTKSYVETLEKLLRTSCDYFKPSQKRLENFNYKNYIIPSMRILLADVLSRRAVINTPANCSNLSESELERLSGVFSGWDIKDGVPINPVIVLHKKYSRELVNMRCIPDIAADKPKVSLRNVSQKYAAFFTFYYTALFYWEAGFIKDEVIEEMLSGLFTARAEGWFGGEFQKVFLNIAKKWCRENFENLENRREEDTSVSEENEKIIIKAFFGIEIYDIKKLLTDIWGEDEYDLFAAGCLISMLTELVSICEVFVRQETDVLERIIHHKSITSVKEYYDLAKDEAARLRSELDDTKRRARQAEKELAEIRREAAEVKPDSVYERKISELTEENKQLRGEAKNAVLELELNNHKKSRYTEKIKQLEEELKKCKAEREAADNKISELKGENKELISCLKELEEDDEGIAVTVSNEDKEIAESCKYTLIVPYFLAAHIRKRLPNCRIIFAVFDGKFDIGQAEAVFVMVNHIKHSQLYRLISQARHTGSEIIHITSSGVNNFVNQVVKYYKEQKGA